MKHSFFSICRLLILGVLLLSFSGCDCFNTKKPSSDTTPPEVTLILMNAGNDASVTSSDGIGATIPFDQSKPVVVMGVATDSGGIKRLYVSGEITLRCSQGGGIETIVYMTMVPIVFEDTTQPQTGDIVIDTRAVMESYDLQEIDRSCRGGKLLSVNGSWSAVAEDYHGNTTTSPFASFSTQ